VSWSTEWDRICRFCVQTGRTDLLRNGRAIEMRAMQMVIHLELIEQAWLAGEFGALGFAAEFMAHGITDTLQRTDPVLHGQLMRGLAEARLKGWPGRLDPARLHALENTLLQTLSNQAIEGIVLTAGEIAAVRRALAAQHLGADGSDSGKGA
jgi:hypothetical protein